MIFSVITELVVGFIFLLRSEKIAREFLDFFNINIFTIGGDFNFMILSTIIAVVGLMFILDSLSIIDSSIRSLFKTKSKKKKISKKQKGGKAKTK